MSVRVPPVVEPVLRPRERPCGGGSSFLRFLRGVGIFTFLLVVSLVGLDYWRDVRIAEYENQLKRDMIERGMSAQEIEAVLRARPTEVRSRERHSVSDSELARHRDVEARLVRDLCSMNCKAEDVEQIVTAFSTHLGSGSGRSARQAAQDADFVRKMVGWGKSASEVEQIIRLQARTRGDLTPVASTRNRPRDSREQVEEALKTLLKSGWTAEELNQVIQQSQLR